jgi:ATP-dependent helicase/nuclease subunit A
MIAERAFTEEQTRAIERRDGPLLVSAGAGAGKTSVLVERFVRSVLEDAAAVESILAITFTEKAAAQLRARVRQRFLECDGREHARAAETAWISTIHGFCARVLRTHALVAGLDPEFRVIDTLEAGRLHRGWNRRRAAGPGRALPRRGARRHGPHHLRPSAQPRS